MPSPPHEAYRTSVREWIPAHADEPDVVPLLERHADALAVLYELDLEPAREVLATCYAANPRGGRPKDPIVLLRSLLVALLVGQPSLNKWVPDLRACRVLRVLAGLPEEDRGPGVGTYYDFLHRLHDGPIRSCGCGHQVAPSEQERRRAEAPQPPRPARQAEQKRGEESVTARLVAELRAARDLPSPVDLLGRLTAILLQVAVAESARRDLLGDPDQVIATGDGSALVTGAAENGRKTCDHGRGQRCDCPRVWTDPDARIGYDSYREHFFFGHHFYEWSVPTAGHDLPIAIRLDPGNTSDFTAGPRSFEHLQKALRAHSLPITIRNVVADAGHDGLEIHRFFREHGADPAIPLKTSAPGTHPERPGLWLSPRGVPLCEAGIEMTPWGSAGADRRVFVCPVKAGKVARCPLSPDTDPGWLCRPDGDLAPTVSVSVSSNPRLCPSIPRSTARYAALMKLRSGCERSNAVKKERFRLEDARHRRASFWLIRLHLIALLQHARAWVAGRSALDFVRELIGHRAAA
jgi:hypothetical protein